MFSEKYGFQDSIAIQIDTMTPTLRNRIWNVFYSYDIQEGGLCSKRLSQSINGQRTIEMKVADSLGFCLDSSISNTAQKKIQNYILNSPWFKVYDFIEKHLECLPDDQRPIREKQYNDVLESEKSGYRIINNEITPITNPEEIKEIKDAMSTTYESVDQHMKKALNLYSNIEKPDYENSIKESISAVESMCCIITESEKDTLGNMLKTLDKKGIYIHPAMIGAFEKMYGYTSNESGIRHGTIDFKNAPEEDARYMLITCSAFINYLKSKFNKSEVMHTM